ncbi:MAG TPA: 5'-deoxynucleotidase [Thiobacillaceae bacterium]
MTSTFLARLARLRWIERWGLKRNITRENVVEHSWEVAVLAHLLANIRNAQFGGDIDANAVAAAALYHDASEGLTGDMPSPVKYHSPEITRAYKAIEHQAQTELWQLLPEPLRERYRPLLLDDAMPTAHHELIKAADLLSALLKCRHETRAGNREFETAQADIALKAERLAATLPEVRYFLDHFEPAFDMTLDELLAKH